MIIHLDYALTEDEFEDISDDFKAVEFWTKDDMYHWVIVDTDDLETKDFCEWIEAYINWWFILREDEDKIILKHVRDDG